MAGPDKDKFDYQNVSDLFIQQLLESGDPCKQKLGLELLVGKKQIVLCNAFEIACARCGWQLQGADIADLWQDTMIDLSKAVQRSNFKITESIDQFVYNILRCKAVSALRKRAVRDAFNRGIDIDEVPVAIDDEPEQAPAIEFDCFLLDYIKALCKLKKLSTSETLVIVHFVTLLVATNECPAPEKLAASVNAERVSKNLGKLTEVAVKSAKRRAIVKLRGPEDEGDEDDR
jgi:DNA-directed RNA polymerase specialized sigma24 family protein